MNKGLTQELALYGAIRRELRKKRFGLLPECCEVFHQRAYFSRDRGTDIVVDVAIEVTLPGASLPFLIWVWESKNHHSPLSVGYIEEFHAKLQQIGADKTKGTIVLAGEIQKSALAYAASKGIGIAKFLPSTRIEFFHATRIEEYCLGEDLATREARIRKEESERSARETFLAMTDPTFIAYNRGFFAQTQEGVPFRGDFEQFLQHGFRELLNCGIWRTDLQAWHWRLQYET